MRYIADAGWRHVDYRSQRWKLRAWCWVAWAESRLRKHCLLLWHLLRLLRMLLLPV